MPNGYSGKILRVNLSTGDISVDEHDEKWYRTYYGGRGIIAYYLLKEVPKGADPLGPENKLIIAAGIMTGSPVPGSGRNSVGALNPETGGYGESEVGGHFGAELKHAGFDGVVFSGKAPKPVYLWVHDGEAELRDATQLWGLPTKESQEAIRAELGDKSIRTAQIGPGGEKMVRFACVINDLKHAAGRAGMGAVMGSKNLKAVAARGHAGPAAADPEKLRTLVRWMAEHWKDLSWGLHEHGTDGGLMGLHVAGGLPTRNFQEGQFEGAEKITGETMTKTVLVGREACYACPVRCKRVVEVHDRYQVDPQYGGAEYETVGALGSCCGVDDLQAISKGHEICNAYSLDTIATGTAIAFAMECYEKGLLTKADTGGIDLRFGNAEAMVQMVQMIADRQGFGDRLAEGCYRLAKEMGGDAMKYAMQVKGQEFPMHEPRFKQGMGMGFAVCPTGACHVQSFHDPSWEKEGGAFFKLTAALGLMDTMALNDLSERKVRAWTYGQQWWSFLNMALHCLLVRYSINQLSEITDALTGWQTSAFELLKMGERGITLTRVVNLHQGLTAQDDWLPDRMFEPFTSGPLKGVAQDRQILRDAIQTYYGMLGWDSQGVPSRAKLAELNIAWAGEYLPGR